MADVTSQGVLSAVARKNVAAGGFVTQDFTTYTEVDAGSDITVTASTVSWDNLDRAVVSYLYKDFGVDYFDGDFTHRFELVVTDPQGPGALQGACHWLMANNLDSQDNLYNSNLSYVTLAYYGTNDQLLLRSNKGGTGVTDDIALNITLGTRYYVTITRDHDGGANSTGQYVATIRTGSHTGTVFDTLTVDVATGDQNSWRYLYGMASFDGNGTPYTVDGETTTLEIKSGL